MLIIAVGDSFPFRNDLANKGHDKLGEEQIDFLLRYIEKNTLVLPEFQREFVWNRDQSRQLVKSLYREFPTGSLLFWKTTKPPALKNKEVLSDAGFVNVILDGQQRLTALYLLVKNAIPPYYGERDIKADPRNLYFNLKNGDLKYFKKSEMSGNPNWVAVTDCFSKNIDYADIAKKTKQSDEDLAGLISTLVKNHNKIKSIIKRQYPILYVPSNTELKDAVWIFDKVNSQGTRLTQAELALAHITSNWSEARREFKRKLEELCNSGFEFNLDFIVRCLAGVLTGRARYELTHDVPKDKLVQAWTMLSRILDYTVNLLKSRMYIASSRDLNTANVLVPLVVYIHKKNFCLNNKELREIQRWIYLALIWRRYTSQVTQKLDQDLSLLDEAEPVKKLVNEILKVSGRINLKESDLKEKGRYHPIFPLLKVLVKRNGGVDWSNGIPISETIGAKYQIESHHIFPKSRLYKSGYDKKNYHHRYMVNEIANRVFLTSEANRGLFSNLPEDYLPQVQKKYPGEIEKQYVPPNKELWKIENYEAFLQERRRMIAEAINKFMNELLEEDRRKKNVAKLIQMPEDQHLEFKSTLRYDLQRKIVNKSLEKECVKNICCFLNTDGGILMIGISDDRRVIGLSFDYQTLKNKTRDGFENHLTNLISSKIGSYFLKFVEISFAELKRKEVCKIRVYRSNKEAFYNEGIQPEFYVRTGNNCRPFSMPDAARYIKEHWS